MFLELDSSDAKALGGLSAFVLLFLCSLTFFFGVSPLITTTILLSFVIVMITALGCSMHLSAIERFEEAEGLEKMRDRVGLHMSLIHDVLTGAESRVQACEAAHSANPDLIRSGLHNLGTARALVDALTERLDTLVKLDLVPSAEMTLKSFTIVETALHVETTPEAEQIPDLPPHLWRDTLDMLLLHIEKQIRTKEEIAA